jgi:glycosyltransferase involved in cell wall biosynthesis
VRILGIADVGYVHTLKWASYLAHRGHEVRLVSFSANTPIAGYPASVRVEPWHLPPFHLKRFWLTLRAILRLRRAAAQFRPHVTQVHFLGHGAWYAMLAGLCPLAVWIMGGDITGTSWEPSSRREGFLGRMTLKRADLVICWSEHLRRLVAPYVRPGKRVEVIVGGVDVELFRPAESKSAVREALGLPPTDFLIFSPRLVWPLYNIATIVNALPVVRREVPQARLLIITHTAGRHQDYLSAVERRIADTRQEESVIMIPTLDQSQIARYFSACDCTVSIPDTDGTPMAVLESLAAGTPAIVHDLPQYDEELFAHERTVLRVPLGNPHALAEAIIRLARDPGLGHELPRRGRELVLRRASYLGEMRRLERLYESLATGHEQ